MIEYLAVIFVIGWWIMPFYVYFDARRRNEQRPFLWAIASYFIPLVFIYWLIIRPKRDDKNGNL